MRNEAWAKRWFSGNTGSGRTATYRGESPLFPIEAVEPVSLMPPLAPTWASAVRTLTVVWAGAGKGIARKMAMAAPARSIAGVRLALIVMLPLFAVS
jgi:hypothetical protein